MHPSVVSQATGDSAQAMETHNDSQPNAFQRSDDPSMAPSTPHAQDSAGGLPQGGSPGSADANGEHDGHTTRTSTTLYDGGSNTVKSTRPIKPNKIYVGNLPASTREEDLEGCFGELGRILGVELKTGYGFVEFETREEAEKAVQKYDGGLFLGNKIRCEVSHGGSKTHKFQSEPGACFKCRQPGHWARECPNEAVDPNWKDFHRSDKPYKRHFNSGHHHSHPPADDMTQRPMRSHGGYTDDTRGDAPTRHPRDYRSDPAVSPVARDYRAPRETRPLSPPSAARNYPRDYDDYRGPPRGPPPPPLATTGYDARMPPDARAYDMRSPYDRPHTYGPSEYERAPPPPARDYGPSSAPPLTSGGYDRPGYGGAPPYGNGRIRSPVSAYEARRDFAPPAPAAGYDAYRGRGPPPPAGAPPGRYDTYSRRRSMSPPPRSAGAYYSEGPTPPPSSTYGSAGPYRGPPSDYPPPSAYYDGPGGPPPGPGGPAIPLYRGPSAREEREGGGERRFVDSRMGGGYERR